MIKTMIEGENNMLKKMFSIQIILYLLSKHLTKLDEFYTEINNNPSIIHTYTQTHVLK